MNVPLQRYTDMLGRYMFPQRWLITALGAGIMAQMGLSLVQPQILRYFVDTALDTSVDAPPNSAITYAAIAFLVVGIFIQLVSLGTSYVGSTMSWNSTNALREDLASHCIRLDMSFHSAHTPGELIQRIDGDVAILGGFFSTFLVRIVGNVLLLFGTLGVLYVENLTVGLVLTASSSVILAIIYGMRAVAVPSNIALSESLSDFSGFIEEHLSGKEDIKALGATNYVLQRFYDAIKRLFRRTLISTYMINGILWTIGFTFSLNHAVVMALGAYLYFNDEATIGTVFMIILYIQILQGPLRSITNELQELQKFRASVERVEELFNTKSEIRNGTGGDLPKGALSVEFCDVSFKYKEDLPTIENVSFQLEKGETLGILGKTGSGKTTIARLLFRFYDVDHGVIRLSGHPIQSYKAANLRSRIGMVTQDVQLLTASVRDNLTFLSPDISDSQIVETIEALGLTDWLRSLPDGLDTSLGPGDSGLSAGQAQLLTFCRVFLYNPGLIILDEASSRLDPASEKMMEGAIDELIRCQTSIIIAHRLETIKRVDNIIILHNGKIVESGKRNALEADPESRFNEFLRISSKGNSFAP